MKGDVRVSGHPKVQETFARIMGYVEQFDIHSPNVRLSAFMRGPRQSAAPVQDAGEFGNGDGVHSRAQGNDVADGRLQITVYESLMFSARLRHSRETGQEVVLAFVREVRCHRPGEVRHQVGSH